eukprot:GHVR01114775.1.p1 GENE.GHVR01114775.1~~GHVR01114775.1.p1  ORF type:complete len:103 (+),score=2.77 GHVR01114775.1:453-761(+)
MEENYEEDMNRTNEIELRKLNEYNKIVQNLTRKKRRKRRKFKDDDRPKRPKNAFILFLEDEKPRILKNYPKMKTTNLVCMAAETYRGMSDSEKLPYLQKYQK